MDRIGRTGQGRSGQVRSGHDRTREDGITDKNITQIRIKRRKRDSQRNAGNVSLMYTHTASQYSHNVRAFRYPGTSSSTWYLVPGYEIGLDIYRSYSRDI